MLAGGSCRWQQVAAVAAGGSCACCGSRCKTRQRPVRCKQPSKTPQSRACRGFCAAQGHALAWTSPVPFMTFPPEEPHCQASACMHAHSHARAHTHTRTTQTCNNCLATVHRALCQSSPAQHTAGRTRSPCPLTAQPCGAGPAHLMHASTGQLGAGLVLEVKHGLRCHAQCKGRAGSVLGLVAQASLIWICALALMHCRLVSNHACGLQHGGMRRARRPMAAWITAAAACIRLSSCVIKLLPTLQCPPLHPLHAPPQGTAGSPPALPSTTCAPPPWPWTSTWRPKGMVGKEAMVGKDG